jgi:hypothetical protein
MFLRGLAIIYLIAFALLLPQISGLVGSNGILPARDYLQNLRSDYGAGAYLLFPTLAWLNSSDVFLKAMVWAGIAFSVLLFVRVVPLAAIIFLFVLYLSIDSIGQTFYSFQWDALLLEVGFAAILLTPAGWRPSYKTPPSTISVWVFRFLIFRLMFESGAVKLLSGDPAWRDLSALSYHYQTQPLPTPLAWYAHQLPASMQKISVAGVFVVELLVPFLFFAPRRLRVIGAWVTIAFQLLIALTGNYTFFNLLTLLLCVPLFVAESKPAPWYAKSAGVVLIVIGLVQLFTMFGIVPNLPEPFAAIDFRVQTFHVVNRYGLFAIMTTSRKEIVIEGSDNGTDWKPYEFKYKPGDVHRRLPWVAPYQPRLDWQMALLESNPFPNAPPQFIRAVAYEYRFTDWATRRKTGAVWARVPVGDYFPVAGLKR